MAGHHRAPYGAPLAFSTTSQRAVRPARKQSDEYLAGLQRERAEFTNFRRRTTEEREQWLGLASESLIRKMLAIADDFDRAIEAMPAELAENPWAQGVAAIDRKDRAGHGELVALAAVGDDGDGSRRLAGGG